MSVLRTYLGGAVISCALAAPLTAQTCLGLPGGQPVNLRLGMGSFQGASQLSGRASIVARRAFVGVSGDVSRTWQYYSSRTRTLGADVGFEVPLGRKKTFAFCPTLGISSEYNRDPYLPRTLEGELIRTGLTSEVLRRVSVAALNFGGSVPITPNIAMVPMASLGVVRRDLRDIRIRSEANPAGTVYFDRTGTQSTVGLLGLGLGVQFSQRYTVSLNLSQAIFDRSARESRVNLGGAIGFGKR